MKEKEYDAVYLIILLVCIFSKNSLKIVFYRIIRHKSKENNLSNGVHVIYNINVTTNWCQNKMRVEHGNHSYISITPIARRRGEAYEMDLVLRNNITTEEHPMGVYHPHAELHHIKKENIGLIEVMGLAVLPARLKAELAALEEAIPTGTDIAMDEILSKHAPWVEELKAKYIFTKENTAEILKEEVGQVFAKVLEHAGVYARTEDGKTALQRFVAFVNC